MPGKRTQVLQIQHTIGHIDCPLCQGSRPVVMGMTPEEFARLPFENAAQVWLNERSRYVSPGTIGAYEDYINRLRKFFDGMILESIQPYHIRAYQAEMSAKIPRPTNENINHDTNTMMQIQEMAGRRTICEEGFRNLPPRKWRKPKVLSEEEKRRFFTVAASNPEWIVALIAPGLTSHTTASGVELRMLQLRHVHMDADPPSVPYIEITEGKEESRLRTIPLNSEAQKYMSLALARARNLGSISPEHFLFPFCDHGRYNPTRPASEYWIYTAFRQVRGAADLPKWLTPHCFRHQIITELLEIGTHEQTLIAIAGHVDRKMIEHYSHIRMKPKAVALESLISTASTKNILRRA